MALGSASLIKHQYVWVDSSFIRPGLTTQTVFEPAIWFGLNAHVGRMWGCHIMLECGAMYRSVPPHAIAFSQTPAIPWEPKAAQMWDVYTNEFSLVIYDYLAPLTAKVKTGIGEFNKAKYLFTAVPLNDGFTDYPEQNKEFMFMRVQDRLTIQPTNRILFEEPSFTVGVGWPILKPQSEVYHCEDK